MSQALEQVKKDLGPDAIILADKKVSVPGNGQQVEVMAAIEREEAKESPRQEPPMARTAELKEDLNEIKGLISLLISSKNTYSRLQMDQSLADLYHSLQARGLDEKQTFLLLKRALARFEGRSVSRGQLLRAVGRQVFDGIKISRPFKNLSPSFHATPVFTFLGPTGVGKTTTLAKIAAELKIRRNLSLGIVSLDTYRIGAVEQLRTYTEILNTPFMVAQSEAEFRQASLKLRGCDVLLVDTIGKNFLREQHIAHLRKIFGNCENTKHFLVLSATAKDRDTRQTILRFRQIPLDSFIFTKVDETLSPGSLLNPLLSFSYPLSYLGTGQRVPEDLEQATRKQLLSFLFPFENGLNGKEKHGSSTGIA